ncbi:MAG TPA: RHS repeat-associated core domain-containing protein, partial [Chitinophaga sp.]
YWEYDGPGPGARCVHTWGDGRLLEGYITYHDGFNVAKDILGRTTVFHYDENKLIVQVTDPEGHHCFTDYTDFQEVFREIDEEGNVTGYRYDDRGNQVAQVRPDGSTLGFDYDDEDRLVMFTDGEGHSTIRTYDEWGRLTSVIHPDNGMLHYGYDELHRLTEIRDNDHRITRLAYDAACNCSDITLPDGSHTHWDYDDAGRCLRRVNPLGGVQSFVYDPLGRVTRIQQADGNIIWLEYNAYDDVLRARDSQHEVSYDYTPLGSIQRRREKNTAVRFRYNEFEELLSITNEHEETNTFHYNKRGELVSQRYFDGSVRNYKRQDNGWLRKVERPGNRYTSYTYDGAGRMVRVEHSDGSWELYNYNRNGQMTEAINEYAAVYITRDMLGRPVSERSVVNGQSYEVQSRYDRLGRRTGMQSSLGAALELAYNETGKVSGMEARHAGQAAAWTAALRYNELGLETDRWLPGGIVSSNSYDRAGLPYRHTVKVTDRATRRRQYAWNANQRLVTMFNEMTNGVVNFGHDDFSNLAWAEYEDGRQQYRTTDAAGNLYQTASRRDRRYDAGGQLVLNNGLAYRYDAEGNLIARDESPGHTWTYDWYGNGLLRQVTRPDGAVVTFEYDALARRTSKLFEPSPGSGTLTRWVWDDDNPLHEWTYAAREKPVLRVNAAGDLVASHAEPLGELTTWIFNEGENSPAAKLQGERRFSVVTNYLGTPVEMYDEQGAKTWELELDIYGQPRIFGKGTRVDCPFRYQGQYEDVETGLYYNRYRYYHPADGLYISKDPIELDGNNPTAYGYVCDTNAWIDVYGLKCWKAAQKQYWKDKAAGELLQRSGRYSQRNIDRMAKGRAPMFRALIKEKKTGNLVTKDVSVELHHTYLPQRLGTEKAHEAWNLTEATPWAHEAMDEFRHTGSELIKIIKTTGQW